MAEGMRLTVKRRAFNCKTMEGLTLQKTVDFVTVPPETLESALKLANGDLNKLLGWVNRGYQDEFVRVTRRSIRSDDPDVVYAPGIVKKFASNFFVRPEIAALDKRSAKYAAAFVMIRSNSVLLETVKMLAQSTEEEAEDEEEDEG